MSNRVKSKLENIFLECGNRDTDCQTGDGRNYRGFTKCTRKQKKCVRWDWDGSPYKKWYKTNVGPHLPQNLCRNPDPEHKDGAWCYTSTDYKNWDYCSIRRCTVCDQGNSLIPLCTKDAPESNFLN